MNKFKFFVESPEEDVFGFGELRAKKQLEEPAKDDNLPIRSFNIQWLMDCIARKKIGNNVKASETMVSGIVWGEKKRIGAIRVRVMPNITVYVERLTSDLNGKQTWILKHVLKPNIKEFAGHEDVVAGDVFEFVEEVYFENIDSATEDYKNLHNLTKRLAGRVKTHAPATFSYQDIKEVNKDYYIVYFALRNAGIGKLVTRTQDLQMSPEATIDINYNRERGLIHIILSTVSIGGDGQGWEMDLPFLDAWYAPSQDKDEIINTVLKVLKFY